MDTAKTDAPRGMTLDAYFEWADKQDGRWEFYDGAPQKMSPQTLGHLELKAQVWAVLKRQAEAASRSFHVLPDGATVRTPDGKVYEPDCLIYAGAPLLRSAIVVEDPLLIVEIVSPSSRDLDLGQKAIDYFNLPSVQHYLVIDPDGPPIVHATRQGPNAYLTRIVREGTIDFAPLGFTVEALDLLLDRREQQAQD